jgi:hypothetical protein
MSGNRLQYEKRCRSTSSEQHCPVRLLAAKRGRKSAPNTATYCHFLAVICGLETTREVAGSIPDYASPYADLDGSGSAMHNLMVATARCKVVTLRGLREQGHGPLRESLTTRTPGSRQGGALDWSGENRGRRCFRRREGDRLLLRDAIDNEKCRQRALIDGGWRLGGIAAQSPRQGRAIERLNGSSTVSSTSTNIDVQSALIHPMAASVGAPVVAVRARPAQCHF